MPKVQKYQESGAVMLETALVLPIFLLTIFSILEISILFYNWFSIDHIAQSVARDVITVGVNSSTPTSADIKDSVRAYSNGFGLSFTDDDILVCPVRFDSSDNSTIGDLNDPASIGCTEESAGNPGDFFVLRLSKPDSLLFGSKDITLYAHTIIKNEPPLN